MSFFYLLGLDEDNFVPTPTEVFKTPTQGPASNIDIPKEEICNDEDKAEMKNLNPSTSVLFLPKAEEFDATRAACQEYLAKPFVVAEDGTLALLSDNLDTLAVPDDTGFWVHINELTPNPYNPDCKIVLNQNDRLVCFKDFDAFHRKNPMCVLQPYSAGEFVLSIYKDVCSIQVFRSICQTGLACSENSHDLCGTWLVDCPFHGTCVEDDEVSFAAPDTCRYPSPTVRLIQSDYVPQKFSVTCQHKDDCLENSMTPNPGLLPRYFLSFYKNDIFFISYDSVHSLELPVSELDAEFQCMYTLDNVNSKKSRSVSRPEIVSGKTAVRNGGRVMLTCLDSGTEHVSDGSVSFEWKTPVTESLPTADDTLLKEGFTDVDVGSYTCRSVVDGVTSVWSKPLDLTIRWDDPVLTATDVEPLYGSQVSLTCTVNVPATFSYIFTQDGVPLTGDRLLQQFEIASFHKQNEGDYQCLAERKGFVVGPSNTVSLSMKPMLPPVLISAMGEVFREGQDVQLTCQIAELSQRHVEYSFIFYNLTDNATLIFNVGTQPDLIIPSFSTDNEGTYECSYTIRGNLAWEYSFSSDFSDNITLRMISVILQTTATTVPAGSDIKLVCNITHYLGRVEKFHWMKVDQNSVLLTTFKNSTMIRNFQPKNAGKYRCQPVLSDPRFRDPALISHPLRLVYAPRYQKCPCVCHADSLSLPSVTPEVIEESTQAIQKNLSVSKAQLSSNVRRVSSAPDSRPSSVSAGYIAVALLSLVTGLVVIPDIVSALHILVQTWAGNSGKKGRFIEEWKMKKTNKTQTSDTEI